MKIRHATHSENTEEKKENVNDVETNNESLEAGEDK